MDAPTEEFGPYLVYEQIGIGGMASVHRAETTGIAGFRRPVALKRMLPHVAANADFVKSFVREAHLASHLRHSNVAQTYDLGKVGEIYFIAMELVNGRNLRELLRHCTKVGIGIPIPITLNILNQICDALDYAHNLCDEAGTPLGIIHRDVSPANIIISDTGLVKLIDFGIAKASASGMQTMSGTIKGKFGYMAPEYLKGQIDSRVDLFALGIIGHELLTNRALFTGNDDMETLQRVRTMPIPKPSSLNPEVPPEIDAVILTALDRNPDQRWQHASAMRIALTAEMKRLKMTILDQQVIEWCEWAYQQTGFDADSMPPTLMLEPDPDSDLIQVLHGDEDATRLQKVAKNRRATTPHFDTPLAGPPLPHSGLPLPAPRESAPIPPLLPIPERPPSPVRIPVAVPAPAREPANAPMSNVMIAMLLFLTAAVAGAVVYFGLPYVS